MTEQDERWLAAQYTVNSRPHFNFIRKLEADELGRLRTARDLLAFVVHGTPHQQLLDAVQALDHSMSDNSKRARTETDEARSRDALSQLIECVRELKDSWTKALAREVDRGTDSVETTRAVASSTTVSDGTSISDLADSLGELTVAASGITLPSGEPIDPLLQAVVQRSELIFARALVPYRSRIDDACLLVNLLQAEVLLGSGVILPEAKVDGWEATLEPIPTHLVTRAQILLEVSERIAKSEASDVRSDPDAVAPGQSGVAEDDLASNGSKGPSPSADHPPAGDPAPSIPPVRISDLASSIEREARAALRVWSSALELADLAESRDRIIASVAAIGAEIARRSSRGTSEPRTLEHQYPPSVESLAALKKEPDDLVEELNSVGELLALELTLRTVSRLTHVLELSVRGGETEYVSWNPDALTRSMALARTLEEIAEGDPEKPWLRSLTKAHRCLEWGLPEAALLYASNYLLGSAATTSENVTLQAVTETASELAIRFAGGDPLPPQVAISYTWPLLDLALEISNP
jgi:hypothetical protein